MNRGARPPAWVVTGAGLAVALACAALTVRSVRAFGPTDFDDAYMFLRYARHWLSGVGLAWNAGDPPQFGVSSPLYLALVTALCAVVRGPRWADGRLLQIASCGAAILALTFLALTCGRFCRHRSLRGNYGIWAAALFVLVTGSEAFAFHVRSGMDTTLALAAATGVAGGALLLAERPSRRNAVLAAALSFLATLARPELVVCAALCPVLCLLWLAPPPRHRVLILFAAVFSSLLALALIVARWRLGTALPLAFWAKRPNFYRGFAGEYGWNPFLFLQVFLRAAWPFLAVLLLLVDRRRWRVTAALLAPTALTFALLFDVNQIMGHLGRFYFPFLAFFVVAAALTFDGYLSQPPLRLSPTRIVLAAVALFAAGPLLESAGRWYQGRATTQRLASLGGYRVDAPLPEIDSWRASDEVAQLAAATPPGTVLAMSEHGLVGARAPHAVIVDVLGLHDRAFARGFDVAELWRRRPDVVWLPHPDHTQMVRDILDSDELWRAYDFYPDAFAFGIALRRESSPAVHAAFDERWRAVYPQSEQQAHRARRSR